jgi:hypothetical protein
VRRGIVTLVNTLSRQLRSGELDEETLPTNASQFEKYSRDVVAAGICRVSVTGGWSTGFPREFKLTPPSPESPRARLEKLKTQGPSEASAATLGAPARAHPAVPNP